MPPRRLTRADGLEPHIGGWPHLFAVSDDLVANGGPDMQFNIFLPREAAYRAWICCGTVFALTP